MRVRMVWAVMLVVLGGCGAGESADVVLRNGQIVTVDESQPEAQAIAIRGDRIVAVGTDAEIEEWIGSGTEVVDLNGRLAIPGLIEGHGHFMSLGESKMNLELGAVRSWGEVVDMVRDAAEQAQPGEWILGRGWHQEKWDALPEGAVEGLPTHHSISAVAPENPVYLTHASGHASFANARAMELAGIDRDYESRPGGEVVRDANGDPIGVLRENDQDPVEEALAAAQANRSQELRQANARRAVELASQEMLENGVTTFHDAGTSFATIDFLREMAEAGDLPVRLYVMVRGESNEAMAERLPEYRMIGVGDNHLTVRSIKRQIDGALGSHGAWLLEPYVDLPSSTGLVLEPVEEIERTAEIALDHDFQLNTHAIGDRANREVLDIYERVFRARGVDPESLRWRIEHAQHVHPEDIPRFAELGVIAAMQGVHATSDAPWVPKRLGEERAAEGAYRWKDFLDAGVVVTNGTDTPVEDIDPLASFYASISRILPDGGRFDPDQRMSREEALRSYTMANAYAAFEEELKGSITPGKLADIVVLSRNIMTIPEEEVLETEVDLTMVGGRILYARETGR